MATTVSMPQLGESVAEGTIGRWLKKPGGLQDDEQLRGGLSADSDRAPKKRGFWARLFGMGNGRDKERKPSGKEER